MDKQMRLSAFCNELAQVLTKKKEFLEQINRIIPWGEWITLIQLSETTRERRFVTRLTVVRVRSRS